MRLGFLKMRCWNWIFLFYLLSFILSIIMAFLFYHAFAYVKTLGFPGYTVPYAIKRIALSASAGLATFQAYTELLRFLFSRKPVIVGEDDRRWLVKFLQNRFSVDEVANIKSAVTALPPWFKFVILYLFAILLALL